MSRGVPKNWVGKHWSWLNKQIRQISSNIEVVKFLTKTADTHMLHYIMQSKINLAKLCIAFV